MSRVDRFWDVDESTEVDAAGAADSRGARPAREGRKRTVEAVAPSSPYEIPGHKAGFSGVLGKLGWFQPMERGGESSTREGEILTTAVIGPPTGARGIAIGRDMLSRALVAHDPFTAYEDGVVSSPAVVLVGGVGTGKSSLLKTVYVLRPLLLKNRRCVVVDKKANGDQGEYADLTRYFGAEPVRVATDDSGVRLNPLDPAIVGMGGAADPMAPVRLLRALAEIAGDRQLGEWEDGSLRAAYRHTHSSQRKRAATMADVVKSLRASDVVAAASGDDKTLRARAVEAGASVALMLEQLVDAYPMIFDGETSKTVKLNAKLTTFDVSQLPDQGPVVDAVVGIVNAWLLGHVARDPGKVTNFVLEEGWHLMTGPNARDIRTKTKLARALGISMVTAIHNPGDIPEDSPGTALLKEAETVHIFRQRTESDRLAAQKMFGLYGDSTELLRALPTGQHLLKVGDRREIRVEHVRSNAERLLTDTDAAMMTREGVRRGEDG